MTTVKKTIPVHMDLEFIYMPDDISGVPDDTLRNWHKRSQILYSMLFRDNDLEQAGYFTRSYLREIHLKLAREITARGISQRQRTFLDDEEAWTMRTTEDANEKNTENIALPTKKAHGRTLCTKLISVAPQEFYLISNLRLPDSTVDTIAAGFQFSEVLGPISLFSVEELLEKYDDKDSIGTLDWGVAFTYHFEGSAKLAPNVEKSKEEEHVATESGTKEGCTEEVEKAADDALEASISIEKYFSPVSGSETAEKRIVYGIVLEPNEVDAQKDTVSEEQIEQAQNMWMIKAQKMGIMHSEFGKNIIPVQSFIAPIDFPTEIYGGPVKKGSWILATYVGDDEIWESIKKGKLTGYSIGGFGHRVPVSSKAKPDKEGGCAQC